MQDLIGLVDSECNNEPHPDVRHWFRGESNVSYRLLPGVYRTPLWKPSGDVELAAQLETKLNNTERHQAREFRMRSASVLGAEMDDPVRLYFLMQHYQMPTRLLDWSTNALIALYFAVEDVAIHNDGKVAFLDAYKFEGGIGVPDWEDVKLCVEACTSLRPGVRFTKSKTFPVTSPHFDRRITLQRGCFTFHVPDQPELVLGEVPGLSVFPVAGEYKDKIKTQLRRMGIDAGTVYGDLSSLSRAIREMSWPD